MKALNRVDITGQQFGHWTVLRYSHTSPAPSWRGYWICRCQCGNERVLRTEYLRSMRRKSCGCLRSEYLSKSNTTHGYAKSNLHRNGRETSEYKTWSHAKGRCENATDASYARYGGRGIKMCEAWRHSFEAFLRDMGPRPIGHSLDRINNDGNYELGNCRWAPPKVQNRNRRTNLVYTHNGVTKCLKDWAAETGLRVGTLQYRWHAGVRGDALFKRVSSHKHSSQNS